MDIVFACNDNYAGPLKTALFSLVTNLSKKWNGKVRFHLFYKSGGFSKTNKQDLIKIAALKDDTFQFHEIEGLDFKLNIDHISEETYYRYKIPEIIPTDKVLYLDADILVRGDISSLFNLDISNYLIAGVFDAYIDQYDSLNHYFSSIGNEQLKGRYFNAGVLLFNAKKMREQNTFLELMNFTKDLPKNIQFQDQDVINLICSNQSLLLPSIYNFASFNMVEELSKPKPSFLKRLLTKETLILHWTGPQKPWLDPYAPNAEEYLKYQKSCNEFLHSKSS